MTSFVLHLAGTTTVPPVGIEERMRQFKFKTAQALSFFKGTELLLVEAWLPAPDGSYSIQIR